MEHPKESQPALSLSLTSLPVRQRLHIMREQQGVKTVTTIQQVFRPHSPAWSLDSSDQRCRLASSTDMAMLDSPLLMWNGGCLKEHTCNRLEQWTQGVRLGLFATLPRSSSPSSS